MRLHTPLRTALRGRVFACVALAGGILAATDTAAYAHLPSTTPLGEITVPFGDIKVPLGEIRVPLGEIKPATPAVSVVVELSQTVVADNDPATSIRTTATWSVQPDGRWTRTIVADNGFREETSGMFDQERFRELQARATSSAVMDAARYSPLDMGCSANNISIRESVGSTQLELINICMGGDEGLSTEWTADQIAAWKTIQEIFESSINI